MTKLRLLLHKFGLWLANRYRPPMWTSPWPITSLDLEAGKITGAQIARQSLIFRGRVDRDEL